MDLIYTNAQRVDLGILLTYALDLSFGIDEAENDFELTLGKTEPLLEDGSVIYRDGTEYGGIVGGMRSNSTDQTRVHLGRTWHGILNGKVISGVCNADQASMIYIENTAKLPIDPKVAAACDKGMVELVNGTWLEDLSDAIETKLN